MLQTVNVAEVTFKCHKSVLIVKDAKKGRKLLKYTFRITGSEDSSTSMILDIVLRDCIALQNSLIPLHFAGKRHKFENDSGFKCPSLEITRLFDIVLPLLKKFTQSINFKYML